MGVLYENTVIGGSCVSGWSPPADAGGTGIITVNLPGALLINKAFLIAGAQGDSTFGQPQPITVTLSNGFSTLPIALNNSTRATKLFTTGYGSNSSVHAVDITSFVNTTVTTYTITVPQQPLTIGRFADFYIAIEWLGALGKTSTQWWINDTSYTSIISRSPVLQTPISTAHPVGVAPLTGYICNDGYIWSGVPSNDALNVTINGNPSIGHIGGLTGSGWCTGSAFLNCTGNYSYANQALIAGFNCNNNLAMNGADALSNAVSRVNNGDTTYTLAFTPAYSGNATHNLWGIATSYVNTVPTYECIFCSYTNPTVTNITTSGATINWCPQGGIVSWQNQVQWRTANTTPWAFFTNVNNASTYTIGGMLSDTAYEFRIVNINTDGAVCQPSAIQRFKTL